MNKEERCVRVTNGKLALKKNAVVEYLHYKIPVTYAIVDSLVEERYRTYQIPVTGSDTRYSANRRHGV